LTNSYKKYNKNAKKKLNLMDKNENENENENLIENVIKNK